jgi:tRNA(Ile)-lysidine synthase
MKNIVNSSVSIPTVFVQKTLNTKEIQAFADQNNLLPANATIVVGLSGGADSVYLIHLLCQLRHERNFTLIAAHLNHEWRTQAGADEQFCRELAHSLGVHFESKRLSELPSLPKYNGSREAFARKARRLFLESIHTKNNADTIALAHHADDQMETFFIRLIRGASLSGLVGMQARSGIYIRPLLTTDKAFLLEELAKTGIPFVEDVSNTSEDYLRNRIRHTALPSLRICDTRFGANFKQTLDRLQQTEEFLTELTTTLFARITTVTDTSLLINVEELSAQHTSMQYRLLIHWLCTEQVPFPPTEAFLNELLRFLESPQGGTHRIHPEWHVRKIRGHASIEKKL